MNNDSKMTIEDLAILMEQRFSAQDTKIETINGRFETVNGQFDMINSRFDTVSDNFAAVRQDIQNLDKKFVTKSKFQQFVAINALQN